MLSLSNRISAIRPSVTIAMAAKARQLKEAGKPIISLTVGEPDFDTPCHIKAAAALAIFQGDTKYTANEGTLALRKAIVEKFRRENHLEYSPAQILVSNGAKQSLFNLFQALLNPGDEVIIFAPYWVSYPEMVMLCEATPVCVQASIQNDLKVTPHEFEKSITPKTKLVILNSPNNPTGMVYSQSELIALAVVLAKHPNIWIVTDDIYEHIYFEEAPFTNILNADPKLYSRTVVVNGVSKAYAMTGWRLGYAAGPLSIIQAMATLQSQSTSNACSISQAAAVAALNGDQSLVRQMCQTFKERQTLIHRLLNELQNVTCLKARGAFYAFPYVQKVIEHLGLEDDTALAEFLLEKAGVATVPGSGFGAPGYLRLSYATSTSVILQAISQIQKFIN